MSSQASFTLRNRNPDVLTCIANLSNDEVFTPPEFANQMLDTLAEAVAAELSRGDLLLTMGAGSVESVAPRVLELLKAVDRA